jgi:hypothetical protein
VPWRLHSHFRLELEREQWICEVDGQPVIFVSAGDAAHHGLVQANSRAGVVFENQFGEENCHIE